MSLSLPRILNSRGIEITIQPVSSREQTEALNRSAESLKATAAELSF